MLPLFVRRAFPVKGAFPLHSSWSVRVVAEGSRLPGQASDFSHGSQPLGQTAGALGPVTSSHEWSNEGQEGLRNTERTTV